MRAIHSAMLDKRRPVLVLTRAHALDRLNSVTVAPITTRARGLRTEVAVGPAGGLHQTCVVSCDNLVTIPASALGKQIGSLLDHQEPALAAAIRWAFDLAP